MINADKLGKRGDADFAAEEASCSMSSSRPRISATHHRRDSTR